MTTASGDRGDRDKGQRIDGALRALDAFGGDSLGGPGPDRDRGPAPAPSPDGGRSARQVEVDLANIDAALGIERGLRDREVEFLESIDRQVRGSRSPLTPPQRAWLSAITIRFGLPWRSA